jgi:hypothetical protein
VVVAEVADEVDGLHADSMAWAMRPVIHAMTGGVTALPASFTRSFLVYFVGM